MMAGADEERIAVERSLAGALDAFEPLVRRSSGMVVRLAYHMLGDWDEARDIAQESFARAYLCLRQYDPQRPFSTWVCTIAARLATDRLRHRRVIWRAGEFLASRAATGARRLDAEAILSLKEALARLTPRQRQAVVLCDLHGFTASEAASMIGCSGSTVRVLRLLARRRLKDLLVHASRPLAAEVEAPE
ncbi:MAG TPA: RNA polymerase sigma factor [Candidatus Polarisedimenticolia bacterium]|jgi:RNA polymerase sigma-70 factor (ECF subfamily)